MDTLRGRNYCPHFIDEEIKVQRGSQLRCGRAIFRTHDSQAVNFWGSTCTWVGPRQLTHGKLGKMRWMPRASQS